MKNNNDETQWLGAIPNDWKLIKGKHLFKQRSEKGNAFELQLLSPTQKYGVIPQSLYEKLSGFSAVKLDEKTDFNTLKTIHKGDYCISLRSFQGGFEYSEYEGVCSPAYQIFFPIDKLCSKYYKYLFKDQCFIDKINSFTLSLRDGKNISFTDFASTYLPYPPLCIQKKIADFLDKKCDEIDTLHSDIEKQIGTLEEYKKSIITEAVTKGLNPDVEMKDSGIEWIGMIPKHWKIYRYKHLASLVRGGSPRPAGNPIYYYGDIPFMKVADITKDDRMYVDSCEGSIKPAGLSNTRMVSKGTLLLTNSGATLGVPKILNIDTTINDGIAAFLNLSNKLNIKFAYYSLKSKTEYFLQVAALGMGQPNLNTDIIGNTYVTIPPKYEQQKIIEFLDVKCAEIDGAIRDKREQLETLEQYKRSLIYEYVTGKKEVQ